MPQLSETNPSRGRRRLLGTGEHVAPQHYSPAVQFGELIWTSGQLPVGADGSTPTEFPQQVELTLDNLERTLQACGASLATVIKVTVYLADINDLNALNEVYARRFAPHGAPARTTVQVAAFRGTKRIELEAVAHREAATEDAESIHG
ncbi:RidA family protein [Nocardia sp. NPDC059239]|uniref:RidA family protein n=1 Tax=Nocardia sp. NPDC059239 TaxID=3346785 RepID=UPI003676DF81